MNSVIEQVNAACQQVRLLNPGPVTFKKLVASTRKHFKLYNIDATIKLAKEKKTLGADEFYVMAYYDAEDDADGFTPIEIIIHHNIETDASFPGHAVTEFLTQVYDATVHEFRHQRQSADRNHILYIEHPGSENYRLYLADPDEVDAYAFSIAIEILRFMPKYRALRYLTRVSVLSKMRSGMGLMSPMLQSYVSHFKNTKLLRRLAKKIHQHIETIDTRHIFM